jgi:hydrogenase expression/formation protein HypD
MKYTDEFRDPVAARRLLEEISALVSTPISVMEFCGGHTHAIMRYGLARVRPRYACFGGGAGVRPTM